MALTITYKTSSFFTQASITGGNTVTCSFGGAPAIGECCIIAISWKGTGILTAVAFGWTKLKSLGGDTSNSRLDVFVKFAESTSNIFAFAATTMSNVMATGRILQKLGTSAWSVAAIGGFDITSNMSWFAQTDSDIQVKTDDVICAFASADKNFGIGTSGFSLGGATFAILSGTTSSFGTSQSGGVIAIAESYRAVTGADVRTHLSMSWSYTTNNTSGPTVWVRVRERKDVGIIEEPIDSHEIGGEGGYIGGIPSAEAFGNICLQVPVPPCECPDPVAVELPTIDDSVISSAPDTGRDILVDPTTNNLALTATGDLALVRGIDSIAQDLRHRCRTFTGEWFLALDAGMPWLTDILGVKNLNLSTVRALLRTLINDTPGVKTILALDVSLNAASRELSISFRVDTDLGEFVETVVTPVDEVV